MISEALRFTGGNGEKVLMHNALTGCPIYEKKVKIFLWLEGDPLSWTVKCIMKW